MALQSSKFDFTKIGILHYLTNAVAEKLDSKFDFVKVTSLDLARLSLDAG